MIRLNLNDHSNPVDGTDNAGINQLSVGQNYPNPFSGDTQIDFSLPVTSDVKIFIKDLTGRTVLIRNLGLMNAGDHQFRLSGTNLEAGHYFYTLQTDDTSQTKKMSIVR